MNKSKNYSQIMVLTCYITKFSLDNSEEHLTNELRALIQALPTANLTVLEHLIALSCNVVKHQELNKMSAENIAIVIGPNIMGPREEDTVQSNASAFKDTPLICAVVRFMIEHYSYIFHHNSPYDPALRGWDELQDKLLRSKSLGITTSSDNLKRLPINNKSVSPVSLSTPTKGTPTSKVSTGTSNKIFRGYMPRSLSENTPVPESICIDQIRISGESLLAFSVPFKLEWEIPYDMISNVEMQNDAYVIIQYKKNKKSDQISTIKITQSEGLDNSILSYPYDLKDWVEHILYVLDRYRDFTKLANDDPEKYGTIVSKDAFLEAKKRKEAKNTTKSTPIVAVGDKVFAQPLESVTPIMRVNYNYLPSTASPLEDDEADEYDSDSDDSVEFRPHSKKSK
jgi:hypothetical protein